MRTIAETQRRWQATWSHGKSLDDIRRAVRGNGHTSPCVSGCRSVCWKLFLLSDDESSDWLQALETGRIDYKSKREHFLRFIKHPEALTELTVDPLADDPDSPWNTVRQDEIIRAEIQQDVQRLPDEADYHEPRVQQTILDVLFVYCKAHPNSGGYRQGMHELLATVLHVISEDALDRSGMGEQPELEGDIATVLDSQLVEHDAYVLFSKLMESAQSFYEMADSAGTSRHVSSPGGTVEQRSAIVDRSRVIHQVFLQKVDPDLARHLTNIEVLPQIFLIRWIRLLFSREFPLHQLLILWDTIFAIDPRLHLINLICVSMLIRIRWQLLGADYSVCLQLLLRYPAPEAPHGPHTFVDDAVYLREHLNTAGGSALIAKYTGKTPQTPSNTEVDTKAFRGINVKGTSGRSPLSSPAKFIQQQGGMESILQGAKGVLERGEKLGINQAVRDAMGEIRRNVQSFNEARQSQRLIPSIVSDADAVKTLAAMELRNKHLASLLDETVANLKSMSAGNTDDKAKSLELIEIAAAKIQFVQIYLEDSTMDVPVFVAPEETPTETQEEPKPKPVEEEEGNQKQASAPKNAGKGAGTTATQRTKPSAQSAGALDKPLPVIASKLNPNPEDKAQANQGQDEDIKDESNASETVKPADGAPVAGQLPTRPAPVPTRSTLAQSSFSWMLEPDQSTPQRNTPAGSKSPPSQHKKRNSNNLNRERNAFLFGDEASNEAERSLSPKSSDIFGMEALPKPKGKLKESLFESE